MIHFVEDKTISEAQLLALSAETVFLATTNDSSSVSLDTDHTHHRSIGNAELRCQTALNDPRSQTLSRPCSSPKRISFVLLYTNLLHGVLLVDPRSCDYAATAKKIGKTGQVT